jgi:hypothetical protein
MKYLLAAAIFACITLPAARAVICGGGPLSILGGFHG